MIDHHIKDCPCGAAYPERVTLIRDKAKRVPYRVGCVSCGRVGPHTGRKNDAVDRWNDAVDGFAEFLYPEAKE